MCCKANPDNTYSDDTIRMPQNCTNVMVNLIMVCIAMNWPNKGIWLSRQNCEAVQVDCVVCKYHSLVKQASIKAAVSCWHFINSQEKR